MATAGGILLSVQPAQICVRSKDDLSHRRAVFLSPRRFAGVSLSSFRSRFPSPVAALALPTANPEKIADLKNIKWSARALKSFGLGYLQARKMRHSNIGTESILLGILVDATSEAAKYLISNGITLDRVHEEIMKIKGEIHWRQFSDFNLPLTESAQKALDSALDLKLKSGDEGEITVGHLILGIWSQKNCTGYKVLVNLWFSRQKAKEMAKIAENDAAPSFR